jgi:hypothetical protein
MAKFLKIMNIQGKFNVLKRLYFLFLLIIKFKKALIHTIRFL